MNRAFKIIIFIIEVIYIIVGLISFFGGVKNNNLEMLGYGLFLLIGAIFLDLLYLQNKLIKLNKNE